METAFIEALCFPTWYHLRYFSQSVIVHIFMFLPYHLRPGTHPRDTRQSWGRSHHDKNWGMQEDSPVSWIYRVHVWRFLLCKFIQRLTFAHFPESLFFWFHVFLFTCSIFSWLFVSLSTHVTLSFRNDFGVFAWMSLLISCLMSVFVITGLVWVIVVDASRQSFETRGYAAFMWKTN